MRAAVVIILVSGLARCSDSLELALGLLSVVEVGLDRLLDGDLTGAVDALTRV